LLNGSSTRAGISPTYPALWLREHPPRQAVGIRDNTSWSCHHGVTRWAGTCPCMPGNSPWKRHLRRALDDLAARLDEVYFDTLRQHIDDPWELRHRLIDVYLGRQTAGELIAALAKGPLTREIDASIRLLLGAQWQRQRMLTSCGWFFDDFDRIEPKNNVAYAARAVALTRQATGIDLAPQARKGLRKVVSWKSGLRGDAVFDRYLASFKAQRTTR
jgi:hypothetical protein